MINQGTISADFAGRPVGSSAAGNFTLTGTNWINQGSIRIVAGETVNLNGSWSNSGSLSVGAGILNLGGSFTTAGSGVFAPAPFANFSGHGGAVNLTGVLDNTGSTVSLDGRTGAWYSLAARSMAARSRPPTATTLSPTTTTAAAS